MSAKNSPRKGTPCYEVPNMTNREVEIFQELLADYFPDPIFNLGGIESFLHDIRGRIWYGRINVSL